MREERLTPADRTRMHIPARRYNALIIAAGFGVFGVLTLTNAPLWDHRSPLELWVLAGLVIAGEMLPIRYTRNGEMSEVVTSTTFSFALLLSWGIAPALLAQVTASLVADLARRKSWWKTAFNAAQYAICLGAAHVVLQLTTGIPRAISPHFLPRDLPFVILAMVALLVLNLVVTGVGMALHHHRSITGFLRDDLSSSLFGDGVLLLLSPVSLIVAEVDLWFLLLLLVPLAGVYILTHENSKLVARLRRQADQNRHQALHDPLTNLPNRTLLQDRIQQGIFRAERDGHRLALMMMDLDRFKEVNDALGHHSGDVLLKQIAKRLRRALRQSDTVARLGGDEFAVLLPHVTDPSAAIAIAEKLAESLREPFAISELSLEARGSIGIALYPDHASDMGPLVQRADVAMYAAKNGPRSWELYATEQDQQSPGRLALVAQLRHAIDHEELVLHYQPKGELSSHRVKSVEALARWRHPRNGIMLPDDFIPLAEHTGLIRPLTLYALNSALKQCRAWEEQGLDLNVAVNLSPQSLLDLQLPEEVQGLLERWKVPATRLKLEITESSIMADPMRAMRVLNELSGMGIGVSIDDFGTGYTSLAYLKRLPIDEIKIDKSLVSHITTNQSDDVIVRSIVELGRNLGLEVVAEGVEDKATWDRLATFGCDTAQGYYLADPMTPNELASWLQGAGQQIQIPFRTI
nr:EAL domain-containing protein [Actinomycetota bacterium]